MLLLAAAASLGGCGEEPAPPPRPPVVLSLSSPRNMETTREPSVLVSGTVRPATARVIVLGSRVTVRGGGFSTTVDLREGTNIVDVGASAPGRRAVWRALRVTRRTRVRVPDLLGRTEDEALAAVADAGLEANVRNDDDLIDAFRRGPRIVCAADPAGGVEVVPGSEVELVVSKTC